MLSPAKGWSRIGRILKYGHVRLDCGCGMLIIHTAPLCIDVSDDEIRQIRVGIKPIVRLAVTSCASYSPMEYNFIVANVINIRVFGKPWASIAAISLATQII